MRRAKTSLNLLEGVAKAAVGGALLLGSVQR
jgi:hypothetical protein